MSWASPVSSSERFTAWRGAVDHEAAAIQVRTGFASHSVFCSLSLTFFSHLSLIFPHVLHVGWKEKKCLWSHVFPSLFSWRWRAIRRETKRHQRRHPLSWTDSWVECEQGVALHTSSGPPASQDISQIASPGYWGLESDSIMDVLALEAKKEPGAETDKKPAPRPKPKPPKKAKRIVYFEVEILDYKTKEKLLLLDKVSVSRMDGFWLLSPFILTIMVFRRQIILTLAAAHCA